MHISESKVTKAYFEVPAGLKQTEHQKKEKQLLRVFYVHFCIWHLMYHWGLQLWMQITILAILAIAVHVVDEHLKECRQLKYTISNPFHLENKCLYSILEVDCRVLYPYVWSKFMNWYNQT